MRCFAEVGEKLDILEKQEESPDLLTAWKKPSTITMEPEKASETDYDAFVKDIPVANSGFGPTSGWDALPVSGSRPVGAFVKDIPVASSGLGPTSGWEPFPVSGSLLVGAFVKDIPVASSEELDPVTKVAQWQQNKAPIQQGTVVFGFKEDFRCKEDF